MENKKKALGLGLEQLFNNENLDIDNIEKKIYNNTVKEEIIEINIDEIRPNPYQPRKIFDDETLKELASSIKEHGVIQPIIVKKSIKGYELVAGERRLRESKKVGLKKIPAILRPFTDQQMMEIGLLENLQRENLSAIEEAQAYQTMLNELNLTQDQLSKKVGKSRSHITNILGLLRLPDKVKEMVNDNRITMGHARALSKLEKDEEIIEIANRIVDEKLVVRDIEKITENDKVSKKVKINRRPKEINPDYKYAEDILRDKLDTKVSIKNKKIEIGFDNVDDLNRILEVIE